ncbi:MFS transporter [Photorhabdus laumondii subsp. laumondii]|nr:MULTISPECIES: MFS transporter [Photorhabdus]AXG44216.1 MFS transporter [Photorhabdus laumondii subsp. laumondii]AXG48845.1 MFS transporter [Photorhabdus laumondii subsp. laumondii]MCC8384810.1 MFS transporter [Photorhabdus laumondii]MCC8389410.1 MFS transporter [Photorhabdus laumondii]MCC8413220.1 MFS transporter [Photorhabdus laumondii]
MSNTAIKPNPISSISLILLSTACGFAVANIYYNQPLLPTIGTSFNVNGSISGWIATLTQIGYAAGLLFFGPLGDTISRRKLIFCLLIGNIISLILCATAPNFTCLLTSSLIVGITSISAQIIIPAVSGWVIPEKRGQAVGSLMSGLFAGALLARALSGAVGEYFGWREMFILAALIDICLFFLIWFVLPEIETPHTMTYGQLLISLGKLVKQQPLLREAALSGFLLFAAFNTLWGSLALLLSQPPYGWGSDIAGLFGLMGIVGMLASPIIGSLTDRFGGRTIVATGALLVTLALCLISGTSHNILFLFAGIILLDLGSRAGLVANQTRLYTLLPEARSRLNTVFMTCYFAGGAIGSSLGAVAAWHFSWYGVAFSGGGCALLAALWVLFNPNSRKQI